MISWIACLSDNKDKKYFCQPPQDAPAQHGLDGISVILSDDYKLKSIIITEDKCSDNQRTVLPKVWTEFSEFEQGMHNNKIVSRVSAMIEHLEDGDVLEANNNDIYDNKKWQYRVGINRDDTYQTAQKRKDLFKGYDGCVIGEDPHRRFA